MSDANYLTLPGRKVRTGWTHKAFVQMIGAMADAGDASLLEIDDLIDVGVPVNALVSANLDVTDGYQEAVEALTSATLNTVVKINQMVRDANDAIA